MASGSKTTLKVKGLRAPFASSTYNLIVIERSQIPDEAPTDPYLPLPRELDDALVIVPLLLGADGPHPDNHVNVVPVQV